MHFNVINLPYGDASHDHRWRSSGAGRHPQILLKPPPGRSTYNRDCSGRKWISKLSAMADLKEPVQPAAQDPEEPKGKESSPNPTIAEPKPPTVLRPTPTLPTGSVPGLRPQGSAFQPPLLRSAKSPSEPSLPASLGLPHPARLRPDTGQQLAGSSDVPNLLRTTSEDELAATTVGSLSGRREHIAGPSGQASQLGGQPSRDSNDDEDDPARRGAQAQQQAMLQQQVSSSAHILFEIEPRLQTSLIA